MKKLLPLFILTILISSAYSQQTTLSFCAGIDNERCAFNNTKFITSPDSTIAKIFMMVAGDNELPLGSTKLVYKIYQLDKTGAETMINTIEQNIEANWIYAWQSAFFYTPGKYTVKVYSDTNRLLNNKSFELIDKL